LATGTTFVVNGGRSNEHSMRFQQPEGGETSGVAAAPLALAVAIVFGLVRSIEMLSLHAAVFGVGMTLVVGLMLVSVLSSPAVGD
jgi:hypothetical protein